MSAKSAAGNVHAMKKSRAVMRIEGFKRQKARKAKFNSVTEVSSNCPFYGIAHKLLYLVGCQVPVRKDPKVIQTIHCSSSGLVPIVMIWFEGIE